MIHQNKENAWFMAGTDTVRSEEGEGSVRWLSQHGTPQRGNTQGVLPTGGLGV